MRLVVIRSVTGLALYTAALESGALPQARTAFAIANLADIPEVTPGPHLSPGGVGLIGPDDAVVDLGAAMHPYHPAVHEPPRRDRYALTAHLVAGAGGEEIDGLVVPDATSRAMRTVLDLFPHVPTTVIPDSLEHYAATVAPKAADLGRIETIVHALQVAPDPARFTRAQHVVLDADAVRAALVGGIDGSAGPRGTATILETPLMRGTHRAAVRTRTGCARVVEGSPVVLGLDPEAAPRHLPAVASSCGGDEAWTVVTLPHAALALTSAGAVVGGPSWELALAAALSDATAVAVGHDGEATTLSGDASRDLPLLAAMLEAAHAAAAPPPPSPATKHGLRRIGAAVVTRVRRAL
ncbi:hypothetical protein [Demequina salsinemoris]|uniref:hypothetical protein n=1 Tax=Demequina salsinemoris TaxID=577470 RepID=UPI000780AFBA|nr:hypothetical protein [Demequina salsinemoris]